MFKVARQNLLQFIRLLLLTQVKPRDHGEPESQNFFISLAIVPAHVPGLVSLTDPANAKVETVPAILYPFELTTVTIELDPIAGIFSCFSKRNE